MVPIPCACQKNKTTYQVMSADGSKVLYTSTSKVAADAIAARPQNAGSTVVEKAK